MFQARFFVELLSILPYIYDLETLRVSAAV